MTAYDDDEEEDDDPTPPNVVRFVPEDKNTCKVILLIVHIILLSL